ncbi:MAG: EVE domain-containing protein [Paracoccaceae bacterium]
MANWLFKSEPSTWSWKDQKEKGDAGEEWDGVRNYQARNFMRDMKLGDFGFFYHSQSEKAIVGIVQVCRECHPDSTSQDARWECVDIKAVQELTRPVTLAQVKADPTLSEMPLANKPRLSVQPVSDAEWAVILHLAKTKMP